MPTSCTNIGALPEAVACIDGAPCRYLVARAVDVNVTLGDLHRTHGHLVVAGSRFNGTVCVAVEAYRLGGDNSTAHVRDVVRQALEDLRLEGTLEC